jgi:hypothetical protein
MRPKRYHRIQENTSLHLYLAEILNCDPMRVTKKYSKVAYLTKDSNCHQGSNFKPGDIEEVNKKLKQFEDDFQKKKNLEQQKQIQAKNYIPLLLLDKFTLSRALSIFDQPQSFIDQEKRIPELPQNLIDLLMHSIVAFSTTHNNSNLTTVADSYLEFIDATQHAEMGIEKAQSNLYPFNSLKE